MVVQELVSQDVANLVELQSVNNRPLGRDGRVVLENLRWRGDHLSLDQTHVELNAGVGGVGDEHRERFAIGDDAFTHRAELGR